MGIPPHEMHKMINMLIRSKYLDALTVTRVFSDTTKRDQKAIDVILRSLLKTRHQFNRTTRAGIYALFQLERLQRPEERKAGSLIRKWKTISQSTGKTARTCTETLRNVSTTFPPHTPLLEALQQHGGVGRTNGADERRSWPHRRK